MHKEQDHVGEVDVDIGKFQDINEAEGEIQIIDKDGQMGGGDIKSDVDYIKSSKTWESFNLPEELMSNLLAQNYKHPSKIQASVVGLFAKKIRKDIIAQSQNGSGKTLSFLIPTILETIEGEKSSKGKSGAYCEPTVMILSDTKELCFQTLKILELIKTKEVRPQVLLRETEEQLNSDTNVLITTIGSLMHNLNKKKIGISNLRFFVLDETDKLFSQDMGRNKMVILFKKITQKNKNAMIGMFSATFTEQVYDIIDSIQRPNIKIKIADDKDLNLKNLTHYYIKCGRKQKLAFMNEFLLRYSVKFFQGSVLIFVNSKKFAENFALKLHEQGHKCEILTSDMEQQDRIDIMDEFKAGKIRILITTNLLSRGIDNRKVSLVINLDLPYTVRKTEEELIRNFDFETYLHRVGRTGRFGDKGIALNVVENERDNEELAKINEKYGINLIEVTIDNFSKLMDTNKANNDYNTVKREFLEENI